MNLYQIRYFLAVAETRNFSKAAERVFVSQPTLSAGIKKLESSLETRLFERSRRRVTLTEAGIRFLPRARAILYECNAARAELAPDGRQQRLKLGLLASLPPARLAPLLSDFQKAHAGIETELREGSPPELADWLEQGRIDAAITLGERMSRENAATGQLPLYRWKLVLAAADGSPFAARTSIQPQALTDRPYIHRSHCDGMADLTRQLTAFGVRPRIVYRTDEDEKALTYVAAGLGVAVVPDSHARDGVTLLPIDGIDVRRSVTLTWRPENTDPAVDAFRLFAASHDWQTHAAQQATQTRLEWAR